MARIPCSRCAKAFRTENGLRWHLVHIHECRDVESLLMEPAPARLAKVAAMRELGLAAFAKGLNTDVQAVQNLIDKHFGEHSSGPLPQGTTQHLPSSNLDKPSGSNGPPFMPPFLPGKSPDLKPINPASQPRHGNVGESRME